MAPPFGFTVSGSGCSSRSQASTTEAKASLISVTSMSRIERPVSFRSFWVAAIGPVSIRTGSEPTRPLATIVARGRRPRLRAFSRVIISTAAAPSEIWDEVPALWTPFGRFVFRPASASSVVSRRPPSRSTRCVSFVGLPSTMPVGASIGTIWASKRRSFQAFAARSWERSPKASVSAREMPHCFAIRSAPSNWEVSSWCSQ
jgi:hypothetical protein